MSRKLVKIIIVAVGVKDEPACLVCHVAATILNSDG